MRIRNFSSTLKFAKANFEEDKLDGNIAFQENFNKIMEKYTKYIRKKVDESIDKADISASEINKIILEDYNRIVDSTYQNTDIPMISMKYIAVKYLSKYRNQIPELLKEIEERKLEYSENELYTDDFHENLLIALLSIQNDYNQYLQNMNQANPEFMVEIEKLKKENENEVAFKKYCDKYSKINGLSYSAKRQIISYGYLSIFGIEGIDENTTSEKKSSALKYKKTNFVKDYITGYLERLEEVYRENLENSIITTFNQLDEFGEIEENIEYHNEKMRRNALPGLGYSTNNNGNNKFDLPNARDLIRKDSLKEIDIDVLLRMNSFYNNRLAKVISEYAKAIFVIDNLKSIKYIYDGNIPTKEDIAEETLDQLMIKYQTLILPIKSFYAESQREIEETPDAFDEKIREVNCGENNSDTKKQILLDIEQFVTQMDKKWSNEYTKYFDTTLPKFNNDLKEDILLTNILYNPVFLSYRFKNMALKSEYAYLHYLSQEEPNKSLNFGVVLNKLREKTVLLASDGGLNLSNRLHTIRREFTEFLKSYTGKPLARIYEGFEDFNVGGEYISSQLLLPVSKKHTKYIKKLKKGKLDEELAKISRITSLNERFIDHTIYCYDNSQFMKAHKVPVNKVNKQGFVVTEYKQPIRFIDLETGRIFTQNENGKLLDKDGVEYSENPKLERDINE